MKNILRVIVMASAMILGATHQAWGAEPYGERCPEVPVTGYDVQLKLAPKIPTGWQPKKSLSEVSKNSVTPSSVQFKVYPEANSTFLHCKYMILDSKLGDFAFYISKPQPTGYACVLNPPGSYFHFVCRPKSTTTPTRTRTTTTPTLSR